MNLKPASVQTLVHRLSGKITHEDVLGPSARLYAYDGKERRIKPTDVGRRIYELAYGAVADIDQAMRIVKGWRIDERSLRVAATLQLWEHRLLGVVAQMRKSERDLSFKMYARGGRGSIELLRTHRCHVAFIGEFEGEDGGLSESLPKRLKLRTYQKLEAVLFLPADPVSGFTIDQDHAFQEALTGARQGGADARRRLFRAIRDSKALILPGRWSVFRQQLEKIFRDQGAEIHPEDVQEFDVGRSILAAVSANLGITIQQPLVVEPARELQVTQISLKGIVPDWQIIAVWDPVDMTKQAYEFLRLCCGGE